MKYSGKSVLVAMAGCLWLGQSMSGQSAATQFAAAPSAASAPTVVPALVPFTAIVEGPDGKALTGEVGMTFLLFKDESGGEPLWVESQRVVVDSTGHYSVELGSSSPSGLPLTVFASGEARWLEVQIAGQKHQPRILLASVPYAAKAAEAATLGGLPASAFMLAGPQTASSAAMSVTPDASSNVTTTGGTANYVPLFTDASTIANSVIVQDGSSVGIGVVPNTSVKLDVGGGMIMRGPMIVSRSGNASATTAYPSFGFAFYSNAYNSSTKAADNPHFLLQSEPTGNNTSNTGATLNLLYSNHGTAPAETGLSINPTGIIQFAPGQTLDFTSSNTTPVVGISTYGEGVYASSTSNDAMYAVSANGIGLVAITTNPTADDAGVYGLAGNETNFSGIAGVWGDSDAYAGVYGTSDSSVGVFGESATDTGVLGVSFGNSNDYARLSGYGFIAPVWGDTNATIDAGILGAVTGTTDDGNAGFFQNNSQDEPTLSVTNLYSGGGGTGLFKTLRASTDEGTCGFGGKGNLTCTGQVKTLATTGSGTRTVETYSVQSPENWMEDFGSGELHSGSGAVSIDRVFAETISRSADYHVFLTPRGDSKGLYVTNATTTGFEVRESGGGAASIGFDYRIIAKRRGYEAQRMVDVTDRFKLEMAATARDLHPSPRPGVRKSTLPAFPSPDSPRKVKSSKSPATPPSRSSAYRPGSE